MLANCPLVSFNAGSIMIKKGERPRSVFLVLQGVGEAIDTQRGIHRTLSGGAIVGELAAVMEEPAFWTVRASSYITAIQIPDQLYLEFIRQNGLEQTTRRQLENRRFLQGTWLFGELLGFPVERALSAHMVPQQARAGARLQPGSSPGLFLLESGDVVLHRDGRPCEKLAPGGFWGEEEVLYGTRIFEALAVSDVRLFVIPAGLIADIPIVQWRLLQTNERRLRTAPAA
jgi:hemerythrin